MRKPQPFTIGTRLSIPKCPDLPTSDPDMEGASKSRSLSNCIPQVSPLSALRGGALSRSPVTCLTDGDQLIAGSLVRSIRKITLSRQADGAVLGEGTVAMSPRLLAKTSHGNCNNNNSRGLRHVLTDGTDPALDWSVRDPRMIISAEECHRTAKSPGSPCASAFSDGVRTAPPAGRASSEPQNIAQLSREIKQAETWVRCKLQDLTDGGDVCPSALLQRDIQGFESTVMKLSQMVDHMCRSQPAAAAHSQLQALRNQWQLLKQMAACQKSAVGGATTLLEFNKKADELEMWMREKEEVPPLHVLLDENLDKIQITRKILVLKQEQIHYCNLQDNINSLAQKLEKPGRPESRAASTRCKHLNRMWLRLQTALHEYHQSLQLALEAASLWHQADAILRAMQEKGRCTVIQNRDDGRGDQDLRDIAGQIMMLDVAVSQVSNLHPLLSSRASHKQRQVKERWARLQLTLRAEKTSRSATSTVPTDPPTFRTPEQSSVGNQKQSPLGCGGPTCQREKTNEERKTRSQGPAVSRRSETNQSPQNSHRPPGPPESPEVGHLLRELSSTSHWLQDVELLLSEPAAMRSPELIRKDLKQVSLLEKELRSRGSALQCLRGNARRCRKPEWAEPDEMEVKVQEVEERFQMLQDALRRRVSDLRDTLVLSEFMKVVQMEEERKKKSHMTTQSVARSDPDILNMDRSETFTPLEELQEAVEMLNDAVKERERALAATREAEELESRVLALSQMMAAARAKLQDVRSQLEATEKEFVAVKRETELKDLQDVTSQQRQVEMDMSGTIGVEVRGLQEKEEQLQGLCPTRSLSARRSIEDALRTWTDLQTLIQGNQARLQRTHRLREFFLRYLGMISWTEVTRGRILSESPGGRLSPTQREELEKTMEGKLKEFEALAGIGWKLIGEDHLLAPMIRERLEEVQGLLSWLLMRWRCQKKQKIMGSQVPKVKTNKAADNMEAPQITAPITPSFVALEEFECPEDEDATPCPAPRGPILRRYRRRALSPILFQPPSCRPPASTDMEEQTHVPEDIPRKCTRGPLWLEPKNLPTGSASPEPQEEAIMVSTYLNMKVEAQDTYQSLTVPRVSKATLPSGHDPLSPSSESSENVLPKISSNIFFKSLRRKEKAQRCTIQGIMGLYSDRKPITKDTPRYETSTWPPKQEKSIVPNIELETFLNYVKNPLSKDIDAECGTCSKKLELKTPRSSPHTIPSSCPRLTVGSVLTLQISKEPHTLDNIQDAITVISTDNSGSGQHLYSTGKPKLTANEMEVAEEHSTINERDPKWSGTRAWLEALTSSSGYCRQNIHGYGRSTASSQEPQDLEDFIDNFEIDRLSPIILQHLDPDWDRQEEALNSSKSPEAASPNCDILGSHNEIRKTIGVTSSSPVTQKTGGTLTLSSTLQEKKATISSTILQETVGGTTSSKALQGTVGTTTSSTVLQEKVGANTMSTVIRETLGAAIATTVFQETVGAMATSTVLRDKVSATASSIVLQETGGATTSSTVLRETVEATTSSTVLRETGGAYGVTMHSRNGQARSTHSFDCVRHSSEHSDHLNDSYSPASTQPVKRIFPKTSSLPEVLHPDHEFLENDDEELEGIWNNAKKVPLVSPAQVSHHVVPKEIVVGSLPPVKSESHGEPYSQVVMGTEPNMLVATFTLPASAMLSTELVTEKRSNTWKENSQNTVPVPENCYPEENGKGNSLPSPQTPSPQTVVKAFKSKVARKLDFHLMEGPLEKKHVLQVGGRKASSRTWGTFYAVLVRRTLCFYHDRRHSTKSSASAPPLHLTGAVCTLESDYTKRDNCFRLQLTDGSEYLFRAPTPESLHQWVTKLRHNSGMEDTDLLRDAALASDLSPRITSRSLMPDLCQSVPAQATNIFPLADSPYWKETENAAAEVPKPKSHHHLPGIFPMSDNDGDPDNNLTCRRRSQSFSSVVYQKVTSVPGPKDPSSSYSVTLYIDDPLIPRGRCHSFAAPQGELLSRHIADLKPQNKSVFRKFFRKKE
ncbi:uncharacterized protein RB166_004169 isoform 2-T2 [Leptodactylus fuscus]|uniref:uncharacterized protein LOC142197189 isoform X2 n=1 Tax=Leptodactylus fuscus TaxID=238119 RepID=UPI003F4EA52C